MSFSNSTGLAVAGLGADLGCLPLLEFVAGEKDGESVVALVLSGIAVGVYGV